MPEVVIETLQNGHDRSAFDCGNDDLNRYLKQLAGQHQRKGFAQVYVAVRLGDLAVLGFATLSMGNVALEDLPEDLRSKLPRHPVPVTHVGRLAVDVSVQGKGIGSLLLAHCASVTVKAADSIGVYAMEIAAKDDVAYAYYLRRGFLPLSRQKNTLYVPVQTLKKALS